MTERDVIMLLNGIAVGVTFATIAFHFFG